MDANARRYNGAPDVQKWTRPVRERERTLPQGMLTLLSHREVNHIEMLHEVTQNNMLNLMDGFAGRDWEQRYDRLAEIREHQEQVAHIEEAHGHEPEIGAVWAGVRRTDEDTSAVGFYGHFQNREGQTTLQFRPVMDNLDHEEAELLAIQLKEQLRERRDQHEIDTDGREYPTIDR